MSKEEFQIVRNSITSLSQTWINIKIMCHVYKSFRTHARTHARKQIKEIIP